MCHFRSKTVKGVRKYVIFFKIRKMQKRRKWNKRLSGNYTRTTRFTWFITKGYVHIVTADLTMIEKLYKRLL
jgi:hypothetical protein